MQFITKKTLRNNFTKQEENKEELYFKSLRSKIGYFDESNYKDIVIGKNKELIEEFANDFKIFKTSLAILEINTKKPIIEINDAYFYVKGEKIIGISKRYDKISMVVLYKLNEDLNINDSGHAKFYDFEKILLDKNTGKVISMNKSEKYNLKSSFSSKE